MSIKLGWHQQGCGRDECNKALECSGLKIAANVGGRRSAAAMPARNPDANASAAAHKHSTMFFM